VQSNRACGIEVGHQDAEFVVAVCGFRLHTDYQNICRDLRLLCGGSGLRRDHRRWFGLKTFQPIKEFLDPFQSVLLGGLHQFAKSRSALLHIRVTISLDVVLLECDGVIDMESRSILENGRDHILTNVRANGVPNIGEQEGGVFGWNLREDGGQSGECVAYSDGTARDGAIGEDENSSGGVDLVLDLSCNALPVELVMLNVVSVDQPRGVEDANLERKRLNVNAHSARSQAPVLTTTPLVVVTSYRRADLV